MKGSKVYVSKYLCVIIDPLANKNGQEMNGRWLIIFYTVIWGDYADGRGTIPLGGGGLLEDVK
jgi:hypothetical protein